MSLHLGIRRPRKHRAVDAVAELRDENRRLLTQVVGAGDRIALIEHDLTEARRQQAQAEQVAACRSFDVEDLKGERDQLTAEVATLRARLAPYLAADANRDAITVPLSVRDITDGADQATAPIDVRELRARFATGPVVTLHHSPHAGDPAHIPVPAA